MDALPSRELTSRLGLSQQYFCGHCARQSTLPRYHGLVLLVQPWVPSFTHASRSCHSVCDGLVSVCRSLVPCKAIFARDFKPGHPLLMLLLHFLLGFVLHRATAVLLG